MSQISCRNPLLSGQKGPVDGVIANFKCPEIRSRDASETVYKIVIERLDGAPTTATLKMRFQGALTTTNGAASQANMTDFVPVWGDIDADKHPDLLPDGDFPAAVATEASTFPVVLFRRIKGGFSHRLAVDMSYSGGTTPGFVMSIENEVRY